MGMSGPSLVLCRATISATFCLYGRLISTLGLSSGCTLFSTGQFATQVPHPVHFASSTKRGRRLIVTVKSPGCPWTRSTSLKVRISMSRCRPISTSRGAMVHMAQSLVGKVLSSWDMPPIPPPTTRAAPIGWVWGASDGIGNNLLGGRLLPGFLLDRLKVQRQRAIDHVRPLSKRHLDGEHGRGDDDVQRVDEMAGELETCVSEDVNGDSTQRRQQEQDRKHQILKPRGLANLLLPPDVTDEDGPDAVQDERGGQIPQPSLRIVEGIEIVGLEPSQPEDLDGENHDDAQGEEPVPRPPPSLRTLPHERVSHRVPHVGPCLCDVSRQGDSLPTHGEPPDAGDTGKQEEQRKEHHREREVRDDREHVLQPKGCRH